jgi:chromosome segregation ATPase
MELPLGDVNIFNTIITDIQTVQTRYDGMITMLNNRMRKSAAEVQRLIVQMGDMDIEVKEYREQLEQSSKTLTRLESENSELTVSNDHLRKVVQSQVGDIERLETIIKQLEQEKIDFTKVSHVVAIEKENAKLRQEIDVLKKRFQEYETKKGEEVVVPVTENENENADEGEEEEEEMEIEVQEKKIKGVVYFVDSKDGKTVYKRNEDGTVGDVVGMLEKHGTKTKIIWN